MFHHRKWIELLHSHYSAPLKIFAIADEERIRAAVPFLQTTTLQGRKKLTSLPFSDHVPILHDGIAGLTALVDGIRSEPATHLQCVAVRSDMENLGLSQSNPWMRHEICLPESSERLKSGYSSALKRNLKKASRNGLQFTEETSREAMERFYRLHVVTRRRLGVPVQRRSFFMSLHENLVESQLGHVALVNRNEEAIAAAVILTYNGTLMYKFAASEPKMRGYRPNEFLIDNVLQSGIKRSYQRFDFGITQRNQHGLRQFKMKWGSAEHPVPVMYLKGDPEMRQAGSLSWGLASQVIRKSPTFVCRAIGAAAYKYSQ